MSTYDTEEDEFIAAVNEGLADGEAGRVYTAKQVIASVQEMLKTK
jgi:predicted transcriptional regulator